MYTSHVRKISKSVTFTVALSILMLGLAYSASIIGTLFHELTHVSNANNLRYMNINYDSSGQTAAESFSRFDTEQNAYMNGVLVMTLLMIIYIICLIVVIRRE